MGEDPLKEITTKVSWAGQVVGWQGGRGGRGARIQEEFAPRPLIGQAPVVISRVSQAQRGHWLDVGFMLEEHRWTSTLYAQASFALAQSI
jgi:hypothetical protein